MKEAMLKIRKRALELDTKKRKELDQYSLNSFGMETKNTYDRWSDYGKCNASKLEVIFTIIAEEIKRGLLK